MRFASGDLPPIKTIFTRFHWLELAEYATTAVSALGTVMAIAGQHIAYATAPLSMAIFLNLINRQRISQQHQQEYLKLKTHLNHCYEDLSGQFPTYVPSSEVNLSEVHEQIHDLQDSLNILENKSASLATKVYQNLSVELNTIRQDISNFSEPFDLSHLENELAILYDQITTLANQPFIDTQHYEQFHASFKHLDQKNREVILPCLKLLVKDVKELKAWHIKHSSKLEQLKQDFIARPELAQLSKVKRVVSQVTESVAQLQQTEVIADLFKSVGQLEHDLNILMDKFDQRPEPQQIQQLKGLVTMLVTTVNQLKRIAKDEDRINIVNELQKFRNLTNNQ